ncbi:DNA cytosine methyltransferase [soil metagenome]
MSDLTTIDLFAGAGGITEGFRQAGYRCLFGNDFSAPAMETFQLNHPDALTECCGIENLDPVAIRKRLGLRRGELAALVGGPPCQGFSINAPDRYLEDPRNSMFKHYLRFVDEFAPSVFLFENVPGMLSLDGGKVFGTIIDEFQRRGYRTSAQILLAAHYGVPQTRWRTIILGSRTGEAPPHPEPTHFYESRPNFKGGSTIAKRLVPLDEFRLLPAVTLRDAISDLPPVLRGEGTEVASYPRKRPSSAFAKSMREGATDLFNHTANAITGVNLERLKHIPSGGAWTSIPFDLLPEGMKKARRSDHTKRYGRPGWNELSGTVLTKCDPHWGAVFHPDQDRTFTVRECARFQSFPDRYCFHGPRVSQYAQVGNAVPVLMARAIAQCIKEAFTNTSAIRPKGVTL